MNDFNYKKSLGQNFLQDKNILENIVKCANISDNALTIEIGPGSGNLTKEIAKLSKQVLCYEIDERLEMVLDDTFRYLVGAYYGISEMDEYDLKEYVLKDIEEYIRSFVKQNPIKNFNYKEEASRVMFDRELKTKLQDSLIVLPKVNASTELILLVKERLKRIREEEIEKL